MNNINNTDNQTTTHTQAKRLSLAQMQLKLLRLERQHELAKQKLERQINNERDKQIKAQARKVRNKLIYDWGGLFPTMLGTELFDQIATEPRFKNVLRGILVKLKYEIEHDGFGSTSEGKLKWLEYYLNQGQLSFKTEAKDSLAVTTSVNQ